MKTRHLLLLAMSLPGLVAPASMFAQAATSAQDPWLAWHGCWKAEAAPADEALCVVPHGKGVRMITVQAGAAVAESRVIADGSARAVTYDDCKGSELAYWSHDRTRLFLQSDLRCSGGQARKARGMFAFLAPAQWLSVQAVTTGDQVATATVRYTAVEPANLPSSIASALTSNRAARFEARVVAAANVDEDDVTEVAANLDAPAVAEWLRSAEQPYGIAAGVESADDATGYTSALDQAGGSAIVYTAAAAHVIRKPVVVHRTYLFGGSYYGRYSPWGYDWYGWRVVTSPFVYVRAGPLVLSTGSVFGHRYPAYTNPRSVIIRQPKWRDGRARRDGYTRDRFDRDRSERDHRAGQSGRERSRDRGSDGPRQPRGPTRRH